MTHAQWEGPAYGYDDYLDDYGSAVRMDKETKLRMFIMAPGKGVIRKGSRGTEVERLQRQLKFLGHDISKIDGAFGPNTKKHVKMAQKTASLKADGVVGPKTWAALSEAVKAEMKRKHLAQRISKAPAVDPALLATMVDLGAHGTPVTPRLPKPTRAPAPGTEWKLFGRGTRSEKWVETALPGGAGTLAHLAAAQRQFLEGVRVPGASQVATAAADVGAPGPPRPEHGVKAFLEAADGVDYTVMGVSGLAGGWLVGTVARGIDVPWWMGALVGLGVAGGAGLAASVKLRHKDSLEGDFAFADELLLE